MVSTNFVGFFWPSGHSITSHIMLAVTARSRPNIRTVLRNTLEAPYAASAGTISPMDLVLDRACNEVEREVDLRLEDEVDGNPRLLPPRGGRRSTDAGI